MHITYLIGNGFDLSCGLETRYTNVYDKYCYTLSPNDNISEFKKTILKNNYENWTDFEMALPEFGEKLDDFKKFSECINDFTLFLGDYLKAEEAKINIDSHKDQLSNHMEQYIYRFFNYCLQNSKEKLKKLIETSSDNITYHFITYNYTDTLEKCLATLRNRMGKSSGSSCVYQYKDPIHIHGSLEEAILLGLDDEKLYKNIPCPNMGSLKNLIDKVYINSRYSTITNQALEVLKQSWVIVIFGWSMGDSDSFWVENLKKLFSSSGNLQLVYVPYYKEPLNRRLRHELLDREDAQKEFIKNKLSIPESNMDRVHIITDPAYMNLNYLVEAGKEKEPATV